jgi:hypothetical protein
MVRRSIVACACFSVLVGSSGAFAASDSVRSLPPSLRGVHVFFYGTRKSPLDRRGARPGRVPEWTAAFTLTPQQPAVVTGSQNVWPPGSLSAFGASQWYGQGYPGWWTGQITLSDPSASVWMLLLAKAGTRYLIDETVSPTAPGQFTITGPDGTTASFPAGTVSPDGCDAPSLQHLTVIYQPDQDGAVNFETQYAASGGTSSGSFCAVTVSIPGL